MLHQSHSQKDKLLKIMQISSSQNNNGSVAASDLKLTGLSTGMMKAKEPKKLWIKAKCDTSERTCKIFRPLRKNSVEKLLRVIFSLDLDPDKHTIPEQRDHNWRHTRKGGPTLDQFQVSTSRWYFPEKLRNCFYFRTAQLKSVRISKVLVRKFVRKSFKVSSRIRSC